MWSLITVTNYSIKLLTLWINAVFSQCVGTSSNLVTSLFPMLMKAVEKNKPVLAVKYLEKARAWINDIIRAVDDMVKR